MFKRFFKSFSYAFQGLKYTFKTQVNFRFHSLALVVVLIASFILEITKTEWLIVLLCISLVLFAELVNTAFEALVDLVSPDIHPLAKIVKDVAAAAVLILAIFSAIIGLLIFIPYLKNLWI